ncbi:TetR/AcrR family transcriptional regulator [Vibrio panuliri]|uniref:TetR family transcriptional regulator n=1 Tax=Vibrio panuliri TaxID=1381081 RepID=A0ABX3F832_9VIBR|nr:TetR/AcrR family transcriptional regulator [Vibrio panuliri]KAB1454049.1 TetR/AcrR family transcriptional regulator [Vibrio panuliri]OLQ84461.1 TetR family transcriptional regulator [Vibrio panuliri]
MTRSEQKRLAIIEAAKQEFIENGFLAANMNNICTAAEVSKRTLYRHFESKELLFEAVLAEVQASTISSRNYPFDANAPLDEQLKRITYQEITVMYQTYGIALSRTIIMEFFRQPELAKTMTQRLYRTQAVSQWFEQAIAANQLVAPNVETITNVYMSVFQGLLFWPQVLDLLAPPEGELLDQKVDVIVITVLRAFAPQ